MLAESEEFHIQRSSLEENMGTKFHVFVAQLSIVASVAISL